MKNIIGILLLIGIILMQVHLSRNKKILWGLLLPVIFFGISLYYTLGVTPISSEINTEMVVVEEGGVTEVLTDTNIENYLEKEFVVNSTLTTFCMGNVMTLILLLIFLYYRRKENRLKNLGKMQVKDL